MKEAANDPLLALAGTWSEADAAAFAEAIAPLGQPDTTTDGGSSDAEHQAGAPPPYQ
jgi:hypothetical protein